LPERKSRSGGDAPPGFGWLCPTEGHRARMLDMGPRVRRARNIAMAAAGVGVLVSTAVGVLGWPAVALFLLAVVNFGTLERRLHRTRRPERLLASTLVLVIALTGCGAALTGGAVSPVLTWLVIPVAMAAARFRAQVVWATAAVAGLAAVLVVATDSPQSALDHPAASISVFVILVAVTSVTTALMDAELQFRGESVLDPLTGLLNRSGLEARFAEVGEQARLLGRPVCLIMCDLDRFKRTNDLHGHEQGDIVLREVSYEMRKSLRTFELFYRIGGEEFLVLLPGIDLPRGAQIAEGMRAAVEASRPGGRTITASLGVAVGTGDRIDFRGLYREADNALYRAKSAGRNLVVASGMRTPGPEMALPAAEPADLVLS
jgi:diguanylate cyclase (GGDEF)-like protein